MIFSGRATGDGRRVSISSSEGSGERADTAKAAKGMILHELSPDCKLSMFKTAEE